MRHTARCFSPLRALTATRRVPDASMSWFVSRSPCDKRRSRPDSRSRATDPRPSRSDRRIRADEQSHRPSPTASARRSASRDAKKARRPQANQPDVRGAVRAPRTVEHHVRLNGPSGAPPDQCGPLAANPSCVAAGSSGKSRARPARAARRRSRSTTRQRPSKTFRYAPPPRKGRRRAVSRDRLPRACGEEREAIASSNTPPWKYGVRPDGQATRPPLARLIEAGRRPRRRRRRRRRPPRAAPNPVTALWPTSRRLPPATAGRRGRETSPGCAQGSTGRLS